MLENIKHSIVLLQIAKNTVHPINGLYQGPSIVPDIQPEFDTIQQGVEFGSECIEKGGTRIDSGTFFKINLRHIYFNNIIIFYQILYPWTRSRQPF